MKQSTILMWRRIQSAFGPLVLLCCIPVASFAGEGPKVSVVPGQERQTHLDLPGDFNRYFGQRVNQFEDSERKVAKLDLDADLSYDGVINATDPADGGAFEQTPPGLVIGKGEMSRFVIRVYPYRIDFDGDVVISLEVTGINRDSESGEFPSLSEELAATGRIRVWKNADRKELLLDSADPNRRSVEWVADGKAYPANLPSIYPRFFFVEGVKPSPRHLGDLRLLVTISHRNKGETSRPTGQWTSEREAGGKNPVTESKSTEGPDAGYNQRLVKAFRTSFDHVLVTVAEQPHEKVFINNNAEGDWVMAPSASQ